jgi:hypothetical protein
MHSVLLSKDNYSTLHCAFDCDVWALQRNQNIMIKFATRDLHKLSFDN